MKGKVVKMIVALRKELMDQPRVEKMRCARREMRNRSGGLALVAICALVGATGTKVAQNPKAEGSRWWKDVSFLASDRMQGRMTGSVGYQVAAGYVAEKFKEEGLSPAGTVGFFQPVKFRSVEIDEGYSSLELIQGSDTSPLTLGKQAILVPIGDSAPEINAGAVFVGYGISAPESNYDDFSGVDLHGRIAVSWGGVPSTIQGTSRLYEEWSGDRWKAMQAAGAIGEAVILNSPSAEITWDWMARYRHRPSLELSDANLRKNQGKRVSLIINPQYASELFAGSGYTLAELMSAARAGQPLPRFPLTVKIHARIRVQETDVESPNVLGELDGTDSELKKEFVIVSAHLDHLGIGTTVNGDEIYSGAMDNAAGVAGLIQIAHDFHESETMPKRSVIFLALGGEEEGELGSWYFANHPTVPANKIAADINMDVFLPLFPLRYLQVQGLDESTLGNDIRAVGQAGGVKVIEDEQPGQGLFIRSDQFSFVQKGIPALAFKFGYEKGSPEERIFSRWVQTRLHTPADNAHQKADHEAAGKFCHLIYMLADHVADDAARPTWEPTSFFRRFKTE